MTDRNEGAPASDPGRFPDGRPKSSPDDTSLLGLAAVWSEIDEPLPPKSSGHGASRHREAARGSHAGRRARRAARRRRVAAPVVLGLVGAVVLTLAVIAFLVVQLS